MNTPTTPGTAPGTAAGLVSRRRPRSWPVLLLALPAFVAIWSGWVGLGGLTGFGMVQPLPGIWDELSVNSAITLPIGVETYAAYALHIWLTRGVDARAVRFAKWSALGSLVLGAGGQVAYHLMVAAGMAQAPWQITAVVACLPVAVLGMGASLAHLVAATPAPVPEAAPAATPDEQVVLDPLPGYHVDAAGKVTPVDLAEPTATEPVPTPVRRPLAPARNGRPAGSSVADTVLKLRGKHPDWTLAQIADKAGCSIRTARRHLNTPTPPPEAPGDVADAA